MADGWDGILYEGETILWQGRPAGGFRLAWDNAFTPFFFLFFTGFSVVWMWFASMAGGVFWMFGLLFFGIGFYNLVLIHFWKSYLRRNTHYTLTDQRAFIARKTLMGKTLESYPIHARSRLKLEEGLRTADLYFATEELRGKKSVRVIDVGFEQIEDAREVMRLMRRIQQLDEAEA
ncbi:MAG: aspartate carbamoyltransferase catalytic subunit [Pseudomonadota bacterium]